MLFFLLTCMMFTIHAQVVVNEPGSVDHLRDRIKAFNEQQKTIDGWRIQVLATTERRMMDKEKIRIKKEYSDLNILEQYKKPYYRIMVGGEKEKNSILPLLYKIKEKYPSAILIKDPEIPKEELLDNL